MGIPAFLVTNFYNVLQNTAHTVTGIEEPSGFEAFRVGTGRRSPQSYWTPSTANAQAWVKVDCGSAKSADLLVIDRVHNLGGVVDVKLQKSTDGFAANTADVATFTIPSSTSSDSTALSSGVRTPEGAYLLSFASASSRYWRVLVPAMGAGLKPQIGGIWLGPVWSPEGLQFPFTDDNEEPLAEQMETPWGWEGRTLTIPRRSGELRMFMADAATYLAADDYLRDQYVRRPMWIVFDIAKAERAMLAKWPLGQRGSFQLDRDPVHRMIVLPYVEHEPLIA